MAHNTTSGHSQNPVHEGTDMRIGRDDGTKQGGEWWHDTNSITRKHSSRSDARKAASAAIAEIPFDLAQHIARVFKPADPARTPRIEPQTQKGQFGNQTNVLQSGL